ncbi:hypothetical protein [Flagellimonas sp. GZD32]|uniref:hypothetical protein n=1 Tax=Flagellimonas cixiensis TaxID=3228750 RepID=UPI0035C8CAD4
MKGIVGGSGVYTSILDLEKWKQALRYNTWISEESKQKMFSSDAVLKNTALEWLFTKLKVRENGCTIMEAGVVQKQ